MKHFYLFMLSASVFWAGCSTINETSRKQMETGIYKARSLDNKHYYVVTAEDTITLHPVKKTKDGWLADTSVAATIHLNSTSEGSRQPVVFIRHRPVFDVLSILFKYRPSVEG